MTDPERFRLLHAAGRELLDALAAEFRVQREPFLDTEQPGGGEPGELLVPDAPGAASFGLTFTEAPGVLTWIAGERRGHSPMCACDACDETAQDCLAGIRGTADMVTRGTFGEDLTIESGRWRRVAWYENSWGARSESRSDPDDEQVEHLLARAPDGLLCWAAWDFRPGREPRRGTGAPGTVRSFDGGAYVIDSPDTPGGCWAPFGHVEPRYTVLEPGRVVVLDWETPAGWEEPLPGGRGFRATRVVAPELTT